MGYYVQSVKRGFVFVFIILGIIFWYFFGPVYKCKDVDKKSEWYVNDIYMSNQYYYENSLNDEQRGVYKQLFDSLNNMEEEIVINHPYNGYVDIVWDALICDHPEMINITTFYYYNHGSSVIIKPIYLTTSKFDLSLKERKVRRKISKIKSKVSGKSDYEKEKYIYEYLGESGAYGQTSKNSDQSAYSALFVTSNTVCAGYGKAAQLLFANCGINSWININSDHLWNTVELEGEYYYFDATLSSLHVNANHTLKGISYRGLNQNALTSSYSVINKPKVEVAGEKYNYYDYEGLTFTYSESILPKLKQIIDESEFNRIDIKFTNYEQAKKEIYKNRNYLGIQKVIEYSGYTIGSNVLTLEK